MNVGWGTLSRATRWVVRRFAAAYIVRDGAAVCSAKRCAIELCTTASCEIAVSRPPASAPRRMRWIVGVR